MQRDKQKVSIAEVVVTSGRIRMTVELECDILFIMGKVV
jgi:hypothetical protein